MVVLSLEEGCEGRLWVRVGAGDKNRVHRARARGEAVSR